MELKAITSRKEAGTPVARMFPSLRRRVDLAFSEPSARALGGCDVVFFATPNGVAMGEARAVLDGGARVVDLSADFRIKDLAEWERWYKIKHAAPELVREAVYGLPEMNRGAACGARGWWRTRAAIRPRCSSASCRWSRRAWSTPTT